jgi:hypothetical protein
MKASEFFRERRGGWILAEAVVFIAVLTVLTGLAADLWMAHLRTSRKLTEELTAERARSAALLYSCHRSAEGAEIGTIVTELQQRYPDLDISGGRDMVTISGEEIFPGACR